MPGLILGPLLTDLIGSLSRYPLVTRSSRLVCVTRCTLGTRRTRGWIRLGGLNTRANGKESAEGHDG